MLPMTDRKQLAVDLRQNTSIVQLLNALAAYLHLWFLFSPFCIPLCAGRSRS